ncbi:MAG TPA: cysteine rich repeat-containing protein [Geomonas sp.]|nr:cysteine rich repeat-containing protein [Geomonas sp.]
MNVFQARLTGSLLFCLLAAPALAADEQPCFREMATFCHDVRWGGGKMIDCLFAHQDQASPACNGFLATMSEKVKEVNRPCQDDIEIFCPDIKAGHGSLIKCLQDNGTEISVECQESMRR